MSKVKVIPLEGGTTPIIHLHGPISPDSHQEELCVEVSPEWLDEWHELLMRLRLYQAHIRELIRQRDGA